MTRMNTEICWRSSVLTALIIYPQMLDRCYTDFHLFQICLTSVDCIGPQADCFEERELWRIDRELKEMGPQADGGGEHQLSSIGQQLKENYFFNCRSRKKVGGLWSGMSSNIQEFIRIFFKLPLYCR